MLFNDLGKLFNWPVNIHDIHSIRGSAKLPKDQVTFFALALRREYTYAIRNIRAIRNDISPTVTIRAVAER
jgi:hypothetical protein